MAKPSAMPARTLWMVVGGGFLAAVLAGSARAQERANPLLIAHRGASGYRPEHTLAAYELAIDQGADYIEPDLVMTRDRVLVARHENDISGTTDVAERFPERRRTKTIDGRTITGFFVEDFDLAEIKRLRARERLASRSHSLDGQLEVPTFDEVLQLVARKEGDAGRRIGIYPETKHPTYHEGLGLAITDSVLAVLERHGYRRRDDPIFIQSFEVGNLRRLARRTGIKLIQLIDADGAPYDWVVAGDRRTYRSMLNAGGLAAIAEYAAGIGVAKELVQPIGADGSLGPPTSLVERAHAAGLVVHVWTLRADSTFLPRGYGGDPAAEGRRFRELGVDAVFTDFPDLIRMAWRR